MKCFGLTDRGIVRDVNQDAFRYYVSEDARDCILVLCDGMGGAAAGELASGLACDAFIDYARKGLSEPKRPLPEDAAAEACAWANLQVYDRAVRDEKCSGMGTTLVGVLVIGDDAVVINVGDSRCYWLVDSQLQQVTRDHSFVQELVDSGALNAEEARSHPRRNLITRAVGLERRIKCDIFRIDLRPGDRLLLCSDGLSNLLTSREIAAVLSENAIEEAAERLMKLALDRGAPDNVTVLIAER